ncbi:MAG: thiol protease/hemagglutinin PrtT [Prevotella sp.]|nr:thiol protease/hemagglutinin PrtT [Prevotella sp.]
MKRYILLLSLFAFCLVSAKANPISSSQAFNQAKAFLSSKGVTLKGEEGSYRQPRKSQAKGEAYYYVFNVGNDQGFVIVSGDDRMEPILGYADEGNFDVADLPDFLQDWLQGYEREIDAYPDTPVPNQKRRVVEKAKKAIAPLTTTKWGHGYPYNANTPSFNGKNAPVGCSPAILAQLLYYYKDKIGPVTYATIPSYSNNGTTLAAVPAGTALDWDNMLTQYPYNSGYTTEQVDAVANLMLYSGKAMSSIYDSNTTLTTTRYFSTALVDYFGFDNSIAYVDREYYSNEQWEDIIYNELAAQRPVAYFAFYQKADQYAGHNLLVDGYDGSGLFHVNWGWDGKYDGYFRLSVLNRYEAGVDTHVNATSYSIDHSALLYVSHSSDGAVNTTAKRLSAKVNVASGTNINCQYINQSGYGGSYYYGLGCIDEEDNMLFLKEFNIRHVPASLGNRSTTSRTFGLSASDFEAQDLDYGTYKVVPIYALNGEDEWKVCQYVPSNYALVDYSSTGVVATRHTISSGLSVTGFELFGSGLKDYEQIVKATIANTSSTEGFTGNVYIFASTTSSVGSAKSYARANLGKDDEVTVDLPFTPDTEGVYRVWIATDESCSNVIGSTSFSIGSGTLTAVNITKGNADYSIMKNYAGKINGIASIYGNSLALNFTNITNPNDYPITMSFNVWLREWDSLSATSWNYNPRYTTYGDNADYDIVDVIIPANSTIELPFVFKDLKYGTKYDVRLEERGKTSTNFITTQALTFLPAVITYYADGTNMAVAPTETVTIDDDAIAVDITDATDITTVVPNANPNVLYYLGETQTVPSGLENSNVVRGKQAGSITLRDGYPFYIYKTFTADEISYTTVTDKGAVAGTALGWNTISLPFDVTGVRNATDNVDIDWFHSKDDLGKAFWVRHFDSVDTENNEVYFEDVEQMEAYEPYIFNVPGDYWGKKWDLRGKEITFFGENALLHQHAHIAASSSVFDFIGTTVGKDATHAYLLNEEGDAFVYSEAARTIPAFRAYFVYSRDDSHTMAGYDRQPLHIKGMEDDKTDAIMMPYANQGEQADIYNLQGVKVASSKLQDGMLDIESLPKGIYIVNGKKMIVSK